jgi:hypothetical protein
MWKGSKVEQYKLHIVLIYLVFGGCERESPTHPIPSTTSTTTDMP